MVSREYWGVVKVQQEGKRNGERERKCEELQNNGKQP